MAFVVCLISCLFFTLTRAGPALFDGYVKCPDGSSAQKDDIGRILACQVGQQGYTPCQSGYQCTETLAGRPGVCCKLGYAAGGTPAPPTYGPAGGTVPPPPTPAPPPPPPPTETLPPPPPVDTMAPPPPPAVTDAPPPPPVDTLPPIQPAPVTDAPPPAPDTVPTDQSTSTTMGAVGGNGGGITPPPPTDFTGLPTDTTLGPAPMVTDGLAAQTDSVMPGETQSTPAVASVDVVTDSNGMVVVSPVSIAQDRKTNKTAASNVQGRRAPVQDTRVSSPPPHGTTVAKAKLPSGTSPSSTPPKASSIAPGAVKAATSSPTPAKAGSNAPGKSTAAYPLSSRPHRRFSDD